MITLLVKSTELHITAAILSFVRRPLHQFSSTTLKKNDAHHILKYIEIQSEEKLTVIPSNSETYISFSFFVPVGKSKNDKLLYEEFRFLDSYRFLSGGLDTLVTTLETKDYCQLSKHFQKNCDTLQRKGVFPYSFLDSFEKLSEKSLPQYGDQWINSLSGQIDVSEEDVQHANKVWNMFGCKNFGDYLMLYLKTDVILLAEVFEKCRRLFDQVYGLDSFITIVHLIFHWMQC